MNVKKEDIIANIRAIIISSKGGLRISNVRADYRETFGTDIPLKAIGYSSLEEFFMKNPENFTVSSGVVNATVKSSSLHIVSLVNRQNSKRRGRSKLSSKQVRNLRKPIKFTNEPAISQNRKSLLSVPPRYARQNSQRNNLTSALREMQEIQKTTSSKPIPSLLGLPNIPCPLLPEKNLPLPSKKTEEKSANYQDSVKNIKRGTVINPSQKDASSKPSDNKSKKESKKVQLDAFQDFEDLHITKNPQSRLIKTKSFEKKLTPNKNEFSEDPGSVFGSPPASPFRRALANNTEEEILSAKRTAQIRLDNNNITTKSGRSPTDLMVDLEDNSKYEHKLKQFCIEKGLILPQYSVIVREPPNQPKCYGCKLTIGDNFNVSTYPVETHSEITARELASKKAFNLLSLNNNLTAAFHETEYVVKLRALCSEKKLPEPTFKSIECRPKNEPGYFICKVRIGEDILLSSYPEEVKDEFSARDLAAKKAYDYILFSKQSSSAVSKSNSETLNQIFEVIKTKEYGVWSNKLPNLYRDTYREELQSGWLELVKNSPQFEITHVDKVGDIVRAKTDVQVDEELYESGSLVPLIVPASNQWEVYITNVVSSTEIWCRLIGKEYSELYDSMMTKLELQPPTVNVSKPAVGEIYSVNLEESWNRVKVIEIFPEKEEATVFLFDIGLEEVVKLSQLFYLHKSFFTVPPQAILLSLNELDSLADCEELKSALFHCLLGNTFIAEIVAILTEGESVSSVNLWDTSTDEDINVNLKLIDEVIRTIKSPRLPPIGLVGEMYVSHVDDNGDIYLQTSKKNAEYVDCIISTKLKNTGKLVPVNKIDTKKLYVTRCNKNGLFYRAKLSKALDNNLVIVKFIDFGYEQQVALRDLYDLELTQIDLATIPCQAVRAKLSNLKVINSKVVSKIREYIHEHTILVKVTKLSSPEVVVEIFRRSQSDGTLSSINNKIVSDEELLVADKPARKKSYVVGLESTLSRDLPMPSIPPIGSYFNVIVTLAAHPGLFSVQPLSNQGQLMELMFRLQEKCEASYTKPLSEEEFKIGELYAVKHSDDYWYRAYAHAVVSSSAFTVCLCDFGDFIIAPADKVMPLPSEFKTLPYQAIRAYLAKVEPANGDWSPLDCVEFREMVVTKQFVSQIVEVNRDAHNPNYITLGLILVDTSTSDDIYIHQELVKKNMAILTP